MLIITFLTIMYPIEDPCMEFYETFVFFDYSPLFVKFCVIFLKNYYTYIVYISILCKDKAIPHLFLIKFEKVIKSEKI